LTKTQPETFLFNKKNKVSIWASKYPYAEIPDQYFEESFSKANTRAKNQWTNNFKMRYFRPEYMETNGTQEGLIEIKKAAGECSFSCSYIDNLLSKAKKKGLLEVSWIVLLFEYEYSAKTTGIENDDYLTLLGAFNYDDDADSLYEVEE
jgi:immunity protein 22 of polymorphic toxin system